jgi:Fanconi anemia group M protein
MFNDIFSRKKEKPESENQKPAKILIDNREKNSLVPSILSKLNIDFEFTHLPTGDYIVNDVVIERKTIPDLKSSIINKRILFQFKELKQYPKSLLIIEGFSTFELYEGIIHENALRGFILSTALEHKIPIIFTENEEDSAKYLAVLAKKTKKTSLSLRQKLQLDKDEQKQFVLEGFPGIGPQTAKKLLHKFKNIKNIINAKEKKLREILGKKTDNFKKVLD